MKSRAKDLGTALETAVVRACHDAGLVAERIAEGGANDLGDVRVYAEETWVVESKARMALNVHEALEKAIGKGGPRTVVYWRRMARKPGNQRRHQVGVPVVAMTLDAFLELLGGEG